MKLLSAQTSNRLPIQCIEERGVETAEKIALQQQRPKDLTEHELYEMAHVLLALNTELESVIEANVQLSCCTFRR
jgi:hypothetical protein